MVRQPIYRSRIAARSQRKLLARRPRRTPRWRWLAAVLAVAGALGYFLVWLTRDDAHDRLQAASPAPPSQLTEPTLAKPKSPAKTSPAPPAVKPAPKEPRFAFYTLLPEKEVTLPEGEVRARKRAEILGRTKAEEYFVQVGSFHSLEDARRIQAELTNLGVKAKLEQVEIGKVLWYRVRIGPFQTLREVEAVRARLRQRQIDSIVQTAKR